jgi:hypothetical protein
MHGPTPTLVQSAIVAPAVSGLKALPRPAPAELRYGLASKFNPSFLL